MPRVGTTLNDRAPLWTSTTSTPSRRPPRRVCLRTDQSCGVGRRRASLLTEKLSIHRSPATSVSVQDLVRVMSSPASGGASIGAGPLLHHTTQPGHHEEENDAG